MEAVKPDYYKLRIGGVNVEFFDVIRAMDLSFPLGMALKYFRKKGNVSKQINDLEKAIVCIQQEIKNLKEQETTESLPF